MSDKVCLSVYEGERLSKVVVASKGDSFTGKELSNALPNESFLRVDATPGNNPRYMLINMTKKLKFKYITNKGNHQQNGYLAPNGSMDFDSDSFLVFFDDNTGHEPVKIVPMGYDPVYSKAGEPSGAGGGSDAESVLAEATAKSKQLISEAMQRSKNIIADAENRSRVTIEQAVAQSKEIHDRANSEYDSIINRAKDEAQEISSVATKRSENVSSAPVDVDSKDEYERLVTDFKNTQEENTNATELIQIYERSRATIDDAAKDVKQQLNAALKSIETLQNSLWNRPFGELAQRVREIDRFLKKTLSLSYADDDVKQVYSAMLSIRKRLVKTLNCIGIDEYIPYEGQTFDPELHEDYDTTSEGLDMLISRCVESGFKNEGGVLIKAIVETIK